MTVAVLTVSLKPVLSMSSNGLLRRLILFRGLSDESLHELECMARERSFRKNEIICRPQEAGRSIFFIKKGSVKLGRQDRNGKEVILYVLRAGNFFGEASLFDGGRELVTATAIEPSEAWMIERGPFMNFVAKHPKVLVRILSTLCHRLYKAEHRFLRLVFADAYEKVALALMESVEDMKIPLSAGVEIPLPLTRKELASMVGVARETFTRVMTDFQRAGLIRVRNRRVAIVNPARLKREANRSGCQ